MRLINTLTLDLSEFFGSDIPRYAILSHTWEENGEITYQEWIARDKTSVTHKLGYQKIIGACRKAYNHGLDWLWVDTNCIDKASSAELSEAINSMFTWYHDSVECYVYLADVDITRVGEVGKDPLFRQSRWFTRGWTLQELLAPTIVLFYSCDWVYLGSRKGSLVEEISEITGIDESALSSAMTMSEASVAAKMSWLSKRETTRIEDLAYCMLGIFGLNMPLLYGEGHNAFHRLQEEIVRTSNDHSIFAWSWNNDVPPDWKSIFAPSPSTFTWAAGLHPSEGAKIASYSITNFGLSIELPLAHSIHSDWILLDVATYDRDLRACIPISKDETSGIYKRQSKLPIPILLPAYRFKKREKLLIQSRPSRLLSQSRDGSIRSSSSNCISQFGVLIFSPTSLYLSDLVERRFDVESSTVPKGALHSDGIFRFGNCNAEADTSPTLLRFQCRGKSAHIEIHPNILSRGSMDVPHDWYIKTHDTSGTHLDTVKQDIRQIRRKDIDPAKARDQYGIFFNLGEVIYLDGAKESRAIFLDKNFKPVLSRVEKVDYTPRYSMSVAGDD